MTTMDTPDDEFWRAPDCEKATGIPAGTWRFWVSTNQGPPSFLLGPRRRVWRKSVVLAWLAEQEATTQRGGAA